MYDVRLLAKKQNENKQRRILYNLRILFYFSSTRFYLLRLGYARGENEKIFRYSPGV